VILNPWSISKRSRQCYGITTQGCSLDIVHWLEYKLCLQRLFKVFR